MSSAKKHICMAEDDADDYYFFSRILEEIDKSVKLTWFVSCESLLEYLKTGNDLPDVIVLDMNMPKINGQVCLTTIKSEALLHHIPVAILSTADCPKGIKTAYEGGAFRYFVKPRNLDGFRKIIQEILTV